MKGSPTVKNNNTVRDTSAVPVGKPALELMEGLEHLMAARPNTERPAPLSVPRTAVRHVGHVDLVDSAEQAGQVVACLLQQRPGWVGLDTEFVPGAMPEATRLRTVQISPAVPRDEGYDIWRGIVFNAERPGVCDALARVLQQPWRFVVHYARAEVESLTAARLPVPHDLFDTHLAARLCTLGTPDWRSFLDPKIEVIGEAEVFEAREAARAIQDRDLSLLGVCTRFGVEHRFAEIKSVMQQRFAAGESLDHQMVAYAAEDARVEAALYLPMVQQLAAQGLLGHFEQIELPALPVFLDIARQGITVDPVRLDRVRIAAEQAIRIYEAELRIQAATVGVRMDNPNSPHQRLALMRAIGLEHLFRAGKTPDRRERYSFSRDRHLKPYRDHHPAIEALYRHALLSRIPSDKLFQGEFTCPDGRVHSRIEPLGANTGRPSFREPNLASVARIFRPVFVPDGANGVIVEIDYRAEEPGIAAAHYRDPAMQEAWNSPKDFYVRMGEDLGVKVKRPVLKVLTLATLYGQTERSTAQSLGMEVFQARKLIERVHKRYPDLARGMREAEKLAYVRGYGETRTGLKRYLSPDIPRHARYRQGRNLPVQGGGADVLKLLLPRAHVCLRQLGGRILVPLFDSLVFQIPREVEQEAIRAIVHEMTVAMQMIYPELQPKLDVNDKDTSCWNKDGGSDSIDRFEKDHAHDIR